MRWRNVLFLAGSLLLIGALGTRAEARDACADAAAPFVRADSIFTEAESAKPDRARALWQSGTDIVSAHRDDVAPVSCVDQDEFDLLRADALLHGLLVGTESGGQDVVSSSNAASGFLDNMRMYAQVRRPFLNVDNEMRRRWPALYEAAENYVQVLNTAAQKELLARHSPNGPGCAHPFVDASSNALVTPPFPRGGMVFDHPVTAEIRVTLDADGKVTASEIVRSSGNRDIDEATLKAARSSTYLPKVADCRRVPGTFTFRATFSPN